MKYQVLLRKIPDNRAPEVIDYSDYEDIGIFEAPSKGLVAHELFKTKNNRSIAVGDVLVDEYGVPYIYTPTFKWAVVSIPK